MNEASELISEIERYCSQNGIAESTFGRLSVGNSKLMGRLREGKGVTLKTMLRVRQYINMNSDMDPERHATDPFDGESYSDSGAGVTGQERKISFEQPFRFYDNRQKYLSFVYTCNEKPIIAQRVLRELQHIQINPPGLRIFDAGIGDGLVLSEILRGVHHVHPKVPVFINGKEISDENVRLCLEKMPDRFFEHPEMVMVISNMRYREAPTLAPSDIREASAMNWIEVPLQGNTSHSFAQQINDLQKVLRDGWQTRRSEKTGNPVPVRPSVIILYRDDHRMLLNHMIPRPNNIINKYDLIIASHPWQARQSADSKISRILLPLVRSLDLGGRLIAFQAAGKDPGFEILKQEWPDENPFTVDRNTLLKKIKSELGREGGLFNLNTASDKKALLKYRMHTLPSEINENLGTSTLMAAWNAAIYVGQIEDEKIETAISHGTYLESTRKILKKYHGLWFYDESFVISRRRG